MLSSIGEAPVSSLDDASLVDVSIAKSILSETSRAIQSQGLHCNTELEYVLTPNTDGELIVPTNCVKIDTSGTSADVDVVQRGSRLYDREKFSYTDFSGTYYVDMVLLLDFADLPEHVKRYITVKSTRRFQARFMGSETLGGFTEKDETEALVYFEQCEAQTENRQMLLDNYDISKIIVRGAPRRAIR
tara:strand:+ start:132 stop:695 length:564 start_codon:yes stop_codon:yes gene_type:complete